jgi:Ca-activated chloride channel homolog
MAGRHAASRAAIDSRAQGRRRRTGRIVATLVGAAVLAGGGVVAVRTAGAHSHHKSVAAPSCTGAVSVPVLAAPTVQAAVAAAAEQWNASHPSVQGQCVRAVVTGVDSAAATKSLASEATPTLWIPDSRLWAGKLAAASPALASAVKVDGSIATSPLVVAAPPGKAGAIGAAAKAGWAGVLSGPAQVTVTDPTTTAAGALIMIGLSAQNGTAPGAAAKLVGLYIRLQTAMLPDSATGLSALQAEPASAPAFVTSEQNVFLANHGNSAPVVSAVYPSGPTPMLDFPMVRVVPTESDPVAAAAMDLFELQLTTQALRSRLAAVGLRDPSGAPLSPDSTTTGISSRPVTPAPATITPAQQAAALHLWSAAAQPSQLLGAIDVSGSMADNSGNGKSKIQVVTAAAETAMTLVPANWTMGLWTFSQHPAPATDWTELVPLGPVKTQRGTLAGAAASLPTRVGGNTGLYDSALAAFEDVSAHYDPASVNVVALLTDGADLDPDSVGLPALLSRLKAGYNPSKPVHIVTIGFGADAGTNALKQISDATHGQSYVVKDPNEILGVLLDSIIANH